MGHGPLFTVASGDLSLVPLRVQGGEFFSIDLDVPIVARPLSHGAGEKSLGEKERAGCRGLGMV